MPSDRMQQEVYRSEFFAQTCNQGTWSRGVRREEATGRELGVPRKPSRTPNHTGDFRHRAVQSTRYTSRATEQSFLRVAQDVHVCPTGSRRHAEQVDATGCDEIY